jgi:4'-phosphopantetheinyl transferase
MLPPDDPHPAHGRWQPGPATPWLDARSVHVWRARTNAPLGHASRPEELLTPEEQARAARFHTQADRTRWARGRARLRILLGRYLQADPATLRFEYGPRGKPALTAACNHLGLYFNVTHPGDWMLCAVGRQAVGVDVAQVGPKIDSLGLAQRWFKESEYRVLCRLPSTLRLQAFIAVWTRKEAYLKARGNGLLAGLDSIEVTVDPREPAALRVDKRDPNAPFLWSLVDLAVTPSYRASLAFQGRGYAIRLSAGSGSGPDRSRRSGTRVPPWSATPSSTTTP